MNKASGEPTGAAAQDWERENFTPEQIEVLHEAADTLTKGMPWLLAPCRDARIVAVRACFPRSVFGKRQDDLVLRAIFAVKFDATSGKLVAKNPGFHEILKAALRCYTSPKNQRAISQLEGAPIGSLPWLAFELYKCADYGDLFAPKTDAEFFSRIAVDLNYLDNQKPTLGDFAVEALQNAFVGLMQSKYDWGKKGLPTKGDVIAMAKEHLARSRKSKKSGWTKMLKDAGLTWLPEGRAGRPSKREVDENVKAKQEFLSKQTQYVNETLDGDWSRLNERAGHVFRGKQLYQEDAQTPMVPSPAKKKQNR
jgi:hypothetical protein